MKNIAISFTLIISFILFSFGAMSESTADPYFVALKSKETNLRTGPNIRYPIKYKLTRKFEPLKVINKFEHWRQVEDSSGDKGWIHIGNLTAKKMAKTQCNANISLYSKPDTTSQIEAYVGNDVLFVVIICKGAWCKLDKDGTRGWIEKKYLWGAISDQ